MKNVEIKKAVKIVQDELTKVGLMTPGNGFDFKVSIMVEQIENNRGEAVKNMVAKWNETFPLYVNKFIVYRAVSYTHLTLPTNREV